VKVYATYARHGDEQPWQLTAISGQSAERARSLAEREQRRPGSTLCGARLCVREFEGSQGVPWSLSFTV
jgi:hypothetical protein